jgi:hypothetical protein
MKRIVGLVAVLALMLPSVALANGGSTCQAYSAELCGSVSGNTAQKTTASTLPFTGLDVVLLVAGGGALLGTGLVVRRLSRDLS